MRIRSFLHQLRQKFSGFDTVKVVLLAALLLFSGQASAQQSIPQLMLFDGASSYHLEKVASFIRERKEAVAFSTSPTDTGIINSMEVQALSENGAYWMALSLHNPSDQAVEWFLFAPYFSLSGSGLWAPRIDEQKIINVSVNEGPKPRRVSDPLGDRFLIRMNPGVRVTVIAELASLDLRGARLIDRAASQSEQISLSLYRGIIIGTVGLIALCLLILFMACGGLACLSAGLFASFVMIYLSIDFGYLASTFTLSPDLVARYRAAFEALLAAALMAFLFTYLRLMRWYLQLAHFVVIGFVCLLGVALLGIFEPERTIMIARLTMPLVGAAGLIILLILISRGVERATVLLPVWCLYILWLAGAGALIGGYASTPIASLVVLSGLVFIALMFGFSLLQYELISGTGQRRLSDQEVRALALSGGGAMVWDFDIKHNRLLVGPELERLLGHVVGVMSGAFNVWLDFIHPDDRDSLKAALDSAVKKKQGCLSFELRLRDHYRGYHWFKLLARPLVNSEGTCLRCVGTLTDINGRVNRISKIESNALYDVLTDLPNQTLLLDRLQQTISTPERARVQLPFLIRIKFEPESIRPDSDVGASVDALAIPLASRLKRLVQPGETLSRIDGLDFIFLGQGQIEPSVIAKKAKAMLDCALDPIEINGQFRHVAGFGGIALYDSKQEKAEAMLSNVGLALERARMLGKGRIETYNQSVRVLVPPGKRRFDNIQERVSIQDVMIRAHSVVQLSDKKTFALALDPEWFVNEAELIQYNQMTDKDLPLDILHDIGIQLIHQMVGGLSLRVRKFTPDPIHLSLPAHLFDSDDVYKEIKHLISQSGIGADRVTFLVDGPDIARRSEQAIGRLKRYADLGVGLGIKHFGEGLGLLEVFKYCPISFVYHQPEPSLDMDEQMNFLKALALFCGTLRINLVIGGIHSKENLISAEKAGAGFGQGAYFDKGDVFYDAAKKRTFV